MSGDHNQYQKDKSYLDFECPRCGHCCQQEHMTIIDKGCYERGCACYDDRVDKDGVAVVGTKTWFEDGKVVTQNLYASDIYKAPPKQWVGLTDEEILAELPVTTSRPATSFARAIEAKLKEKNT